MNGSMHGLQYSSSFPTLFSQLTPARLSPPVDPGSGVPSQKGNPE